MIVGKIQEEGFPSPLALVIWSLPSVSIYIAEVFHPHRVAGTLQYIYGTVVTACLPPEGNIHLVMDDECPQQPKEKILINLEKIF